MTDLQCPARFELVVSGPGDAEAADHELRDVADAWSELEALADLHRGETVVVAVRPDQVAQLPSGLRPPARWEVDADGWRRVAPTG